MDILQLTQTVYLNTSNVMIGGKGINETTIYCAMNGSRKEAFIINGNFIKVESLTLSGCNDGSAVIINGNQSRRNNFLNVYFERVSFINNGRIHDFVSGGAINIHTCLEDSCITPVVNIQQCIFLENKAKAGGAIFGENCKLRISNSTFVRNEAVVDGGAIYLATRGPILEIQSCSFIANSARDNDVYSRDSLTPISGGGALFIRAPQRLTIQDSDFSDNIVDMTGGAVCIVDEIPNTSKESSVSLLVNNSTFSNNRINSTFLLMSNGLSTDDNLFHSGGALLLNLQSVLSVNVLIQSSSFHQNTALRGGAVLLHAPGESRCQIQSCLFIENEANVAGGAVGSHNGHLVVNGSSFIGNRARLGGSLSITEDADLIIGPDMQTGLPSIFKSNKAFYGGGIYVALRSSMTLEAVQFQNNQALRNGGAVRVYDTSYPVVIHGAQFVNNSAMIGGAIGVEAVANFEMDTFNGVPTRILSNVAAAGGGLLRTTGTLVYETLYIRNTEFKDNEALSLSDPLVQNIEQSALDDPYFQSMISELRSRFPGEYSLEAVFAQLSSFPEGYGGGFLIETADLGAYTIAEVLFENITMTGNEARVGGAGYLSGHVAFWNAVPSLSCFPAFFMLDSCQRLLFQNVSVSGNQAEYAGGLFVSKPETVMLTCNMNVAGRNTTLLKAMQMRLQGQNHSTSFNESYCTEIHSNLISDGESIEGADVGSSVASLHLVNFTQTLRTVASGERITMPCEDEDDSECQRYLTVAIKDAFNQTIHHGTEDANLDLTLSSSSVIGDLRYTATNGTVKINNTSAWGINITSAELTIQATANPSMKVTVNFTTRPCIIGEHIHESLCSPCPPDQYGFDPLQNSCAPCEENAICKGKTVLVPIDGYWHSTPFSPQFHPCVYPEACTFDDRTENLVSFHEDWTQLQRLLSELELYNIGEAELPDFSVYQQCAEGYEGVLCGSCAQGYGHGLTGECAECPNERDSIILTVAFFLWIFLIIGVNALTTLLSARARIELVRFELKKMTSSQSQPVLNRMTSHVHERKVAEIQSRASIITNLSIASIESTRQLYHDKLAAAVQMTEVLKILLNYLQVTSAAMRLQVEWQSVMRGLLSTEGAFVGMACDTFTAPFECHFGRTGFGHPSIAALWLRMLTPSFVLCALILLFSIIWLITTWKFNITKLSTNHSPCSTIGYWKTGVIVITIVTVYFSFIDVVRELLKTVNCVEVDEKLDSNVLYSDYSIANSGRVWIEDTNLMCFQGSHKGTGIAGIVGLLFALIVTISIVFWLPLNSKHRKKPQFIARYWFLYQGYRREWYTVGWEAVILTRKALMAAVIVFAVHLGQNLQATLCVSILLFALMIQLTFKPFKDCQNAITVPEYFSEFLYSIPLPKLLSKWLEFSNSIDLNSLESASLFASITVFLSAAVLSDSHTSDVGKALITAITFSINILYLIFMLYRLYSGLHRAVDMKLELMDPAFMATNPNGPGVINLIRKGYRIVWNYVNEYRAQDQQTESEASPSLDNSGSDASEALSQAERAPND
eukprot:g2946.t1